MQGRSIILLRDQEATAWLQEPGNIERWEKLYRNCPWRLATLSPAFCLAWLRHYGDRWAPVLILEQTGDQLVHLMPLAASGDRIVGMGAHQAEYQGWLSAVSSGGCEFLTEALHRCTDAFPSLPVHLRYLVPALSRSCGDALATVSPGTILRYHSRPLLPLAPESLEKSLRKRATRSKLNRLAAQGELVFEFPDTLIRTLRTLADLAPLYDLRQGAINDVCPFVDDKDKLPFLSDWLQHATPGDFHLGSIRLDGQLIAGLLTVNGVDTASVAIIAHSPLHDRQSPGKLQLYRSALFLAREGFSMLDLTPGGDPWKERFAREHDLVAELICYPRRVDYLRHRFRETARRQVRSLFDPFARGLSSAGRRLRSAFQTLPRAFPISPLPRLRPTIGGWITRPLHSPSPFSRLTAPPPPMNEAKTERLWKFVDIPFKIWPSRRYYYRLTIDPARFGGEGTDPTLGLGVNRPDQLVRYHSMRRPRRLFLGDCIDRLRHAEQIWSVTEGNRLIAAWCHCRPRGPGSMGGRFRPAEKGKVDVFFFEALYSETGSRGFSAVRMVIERAVREIRENDFEGNIVIELGPTELSLAEWRKLEGIGHLERWSALRSRKIWHRLQ